MATACEVSGGGGRRGARAPVRPVRRRTGEMNSSRLSDAGGLLRSGIGFPRRMTHMMALASPAIIAEISKLRPILLCPRSADFGPEFGRHVAG